ncbi:hypothetical protein [Phaeobacter porticola]|uniref:Peptidase propeptide and YPEB domain protein n=1 Tax=Phaeobacter porticola TaxID=1844006 RepID=A0A1L3I8A3_9RHOB|nr:hypothetical protein [Phaeobacter porticola]APG48364.1 hypothetical protein PhaeoP97_02989 [Phaeobacter porticola]
MLKTTFKGTFVKSAALCVTLASANLIALPAVAQTSNSCAPREQVVKRLAERYGESRQSIGIGQRGVVMETFASEESGSWTITVTTPGGVTCLVASGQAYEFLAEALPVTDSDA